MVVLQVVLLIGFALLLVKSTELVVGAIKYFASVTKLGSYGITAFVLAFATSIPELVVGIVAAIEGSTPLVLGNVLGSNIADLTIVVGGAAIVGGGIRVVGDFLRKDLFLTFLAGSMPLLLLLDNRLTRIDGVVLLVVYVVYVFTVLTKKGRDLGGVQIEQSSFKRILYLINRSKPNKRIGQFLLGVILLLFSSHMIVQLAQSIAAGFNIPILLVGLFLVAIGTSLPELAFELRAVRSGDVGMVFGDLLGSVVANSTLIIGITSLINPVRLNGGLQPYLYGTIAFVVIFLTFWLFVSTKKRLEIWEGVGLIVLYVIFAIVEIF